jgi:hypothetical protein
MKTQTIDKYTYDAEDIQKLIYEDICKRNGPVKKSMVNIKFVLASEPDDGPVHPTYLLDVSADVSADVSVVVTNK